MSAACETNKKGSSLSHVILSGGTFPFDVSGYSNSNGNGNRACAWFIPQAAATIVYKRQKDDASETLVALAGVKYEVQASEITSLSAGGLLIGW